MVQNVVGYLMGHHKGEFVVVGDGVHHAVSHGNVSAIRPGIGGAALKHRKSAATSLTAAYLNARSAGCPPYLKARGTGMQCRFKVIEKSFGAIEAGCGAD